jgi:polyisoprenoid-binding protein YceI
MKHIIFIIILAIIGVLFFTLGKKDAVAPLGDIQTGEEVSELENTMPSTAVADGVYLVDTDMSSVVWSGKKTLVTNWIDSGNIKMKSGTFTVTDGTISEGSVVFDMNSIVAMKTGAGGGEDKLSTHLKSGDFFDVVKFPTATFTMKQADATSITGDMTIHGITKEITVPVSMMMHNDVTMIAGKTSLDRALFDIKFGSSSFFNDLKDNVIDDLFTLDFIIVAK